MHQSDLIPDHCVLTSTVHTLNNRLERTGLVNLSPESTSDTRFCVLGDHAAPMLTPAAKLAEADLQCTLAVSIHAGNQALRESLVPRCLPGPSLLSPLDSAEMPFACLWADRV